MNFFKFDVIKGYRRIITTKNSTMRYMGFDVLVLEAGEKSTIEIQDEELVLILQSGDFKACVENPYGEGLKDISASRKNVFDDMPAAIYLPHGSRLEIESKGGMEARIFSATCSESGDARFISPGSVVEARRGVLNWQRQVRVLFGPQSVTKKLIIGESVSVPGGWIGFPPHKHDLENDAEFPLDEIYSYRVKGPHGAYAIQHTYDTDKHINELYAINNDNIAVAVPGGYHTTTAVPGCKFYLLWGLAGDKKIYKLTTDPRFSWLLDSEALFG